MAPGESDGGVAISCWENDGRDIVIEDGGVSSVTADADELSSMTEGV